MRQRILKLLRSLAERFPILAKIVRNKLGLAQPVLTDEPGEDDIPPEALVALREFNRSQYLKSKSGKTAKEITVRTLRDSAGLISSVTIKCEVPELKGVE